MRTKILLIALIGMSFGMKAQITELPNGNVGIGTTNPENNNGWNRVLNIYGTSHSKITTSSSNVNTGIWSHNSGYYGAPAGGILGTYSNHPISFITNKSTKMTITPSGNVGIGTTNPENNNGWNRVLNVYGTSHSKITTSSSNVNTGIWSHNSGYYGAPAGGILGTYSNHPISFITNKSTKMTITPSGNVGIGTTNPGSWQLAVNGKIRAKEIKVETGWSDFVFENDYLLPTLTEVETHIKKKGHLKDIPSAKEVAKNGILLGEMDSKLLQKIEELTLYTIAQQKEIERLKLIEKRLSKIEKLLESKK
jgi:hypothetical protein